MQSEFQKVFVWFLKREVLILEADKMMEILGSHTNLKNENLEWNDF